MAFFSNLSYSRINGSDDVNDTNDVTSIPKEKAADAVFFPWNNPENLITLETLTTVEKVVTCGLNPILLAVGLPGNVLSLIVFKRQGLGDRITVSLFSLALVDLMVVVLWFMLGSFCLLGHAVPSLPYVLDWWKWIVRKYIRGCYCGFYSSSGCLTMMIAVERCLCVVLPLKAANLVHTRAMTSIIVLTVISLQLLCLAIPFKYDVVTTYDEVSNTTVVLVPHTSQYLDHKTLIDVIENTIVMTVIPVVTFVVVSVATVVTVIKLKRVIAWREEAARNVVRQSEVGLVKMLVIVSCIYIVTALPDIVLGTVRILTSSHFSVAGKYRNAYVMTHLLFLGLGPINSTVNFFVYVTHSSRFRMELYRMFPCCSRPKESTSKSSHSSSSREMTSLRININSVSATADWTEGGWGSSEREATTVEPMSTFSARQNRQARTCKNNVTG